MRLMLLRHAKADRPPGVADVDRPLAKSGREDAARLGARLAADGLVPDLVLVSPALRTRETAEHVFAAAGATPELRVEPSLYEASADEILAALRAAAGPSVMVIGHNPGMHEAALRLAGSGDGLEPLRRGFPTAALAVFDAPDGPLGEAPLRLARFIAGRDEA